MNSLSNLSKKLAIPFLLVFATHFSVLAQNPVESTHVDEKYAYTTVVYKNKAANDQDVLSSIESEFGIGDVIRITLAPPPSPISAIAASEPVYADKKKGEDNWLPEATQSGYNLSVSSKELGMPKTPVNTISVASKPTPVINRTASPANIEVATTVLSTATDQAQVALPQEITLETKANGATATTSVGGQTSKLASAGKSSKAGKAAKKSSKKGGQKMKFKKRKHSKQRYACPKF